MNKRWNDRLLVLGLVWIALTHAGSTWAEEPTVREIFVPFEDLQTLLEGTTERVLLTRAEYADLLRRAKPSETEAASPASHVLLSAGYEGTVDEGRALLRGTLAVELLRDELLAIPLSLQGGRLFSAQWDGAPASLARNPDGTITLFAQGRGKHELHLEMFVPIATSAAEQSLELQLPMAATTKWRWTVPGNVEVRSGANVVSREVDAESNVTRFDLVPQRELTRIVMSLNNRQLLEDRVVLARSVLLEELTLTYEKLHATISMGIPHGATDRFRFGVPAGFEVLDVNTAQLARWVVTAGENGERILEVSLREPARDTVVLQVVAARYGPNYENWSMPQLRPLDVDNHVAIVGLFAEQRLKPKQLTPDRLIAIDAQVLQSALPASLLSPEPGAPELRPAAAYYAPQSDFALEAVFERAPATLQVTTNLLLTATDRELQLRAGFAIQPREEPIFAVELAVPTGWEIRDVTQPDGKSLQHFQFPNDMGGTRLQVRLPQGAPVGSFTQILVHARQIPAEWLEPWTTKSVPFPQFKIAGATQDIGAIAVLTQDDLVARPEEVSGLTPLDENEKKEFGLEQAGTSLAYRYGSEPYALVVRYERPAPRLTARTFSFFRLAPDGLFAHYEVLYRIESAEAKTLQLRLPLETPTALSITGRDVTVKEFRSEEIDGERRWTVELAEPRAGSVRLLIDFQQSLPTAVRDATSTASTASATLALPIVKADGVAFQSGSFAVEGVMDFDIEFRAEARRIDVGELVEAEYELGKRVLGAFGFLGAPPPATVTITRRPEFGLPPAIVERAELVTLVSTSGISETAARFHLKTKATFLEVQLPAGSTLWSARVGGQPAAPQRDGDRLLLSLGATPSTDLDLQLIYQTPIDRWSRWGGFELAAPLLLLKNSSAATSGTEVPLVDCQWEVLLPHGQQLIEASGSVFATAGSPPSPLEVVRRTVTGWSLAIRPMRAVRIGESTRRDFIDRGEYRYAVDPFGAPIDYLNASPSDAAPAAGLEAGADSKLRYSQPNEPAPTPAQTEPAVVPAAPQTPDVAPTAQAPNGRGGRPGAEPAAAGRAYWALQGVRSLPIELIDSRGPKAVFVSLGVAPELRMTFADRRSLHFAGMALAMIVAVYGVARTRRSFSRHVQFVLVAALLLLLVPLVIGLVTGWELTAMFMPSFAVVGALAVWYCVALAVRGVRQWRRPSTRPLAAAATMILLVLANVGTASAQEPIVEQLRHLLAPPPPVTMPAGAVLIPFNAADPEGVQKATKVFVGYDEYVRLWNQAYPDQPLTTKQPVTAWAASGIQYSASLADGDTLAIRGKLEVTVYADGTHAVGLPVQGAVLTKISVDGQAARMQVLQPEPVPAAPADQAAAPPAQQAVAAPAAAMPSVLVTGAGRKTIEFEVRTRVETRAGWRAVEARLPTFTLAGIELSVPKAGTEIRILEGADGDTVTEIKTTEDAQTRTAAIPTSGQLRLQWRPQVAQVAADPTLTANSTAVLDLQEDALRLTWQVDLQFRQGLREVFEVQVPRGVLIEKVVGANVRGWKATEEGDQIRVTIQLLAPATASERFTLLLSQRAAIGTGMMAGFAAPYVSVPSASLHRGTLVLRRSPLLAVSVEDANGLTRTSADDPQVLEVLGKISDESPLGIREFQTYRFNATPFTLRLDVTPQVAKTSVEIQSVLRIADRENHLEARLSFNVENRPTFRFQCRLPPGLIVEDVTSDQTLEWTVEKGETTDLLQVFLPTGVQQFAVIVRGKLPKGSEPTVPAPFLNVLGVERQIGQLVVQADPAYRVTLEQLQNGESLFLAQVAPWLSAEQLAMARIAVQYRTADATAVIRAVPRPPVVRGFTITNTRVTPFALEDTVYAQLSIVDAGIREVVLNLPATMRNARVTAPLLRQEIWEEIEGAPDRIRLRLQLQDDVTEQFIVVVQHDRPLHSDAIAVPIPQLETGTVENRFVILENVGRDEIVVKQTLQLEELDRQASPWARLVEILKTDPLRAFVVRPSADQPQLVFDLKQRAIVETAGARIGLARTLLVVDAFGAYRGVQEYRVDNKTEQYLEVTLPPGAELWTARVAGEAVKPVVLAGYQAGQVAIPLIKSATGDLDYPVELKYGGRLTLPRGMGKVRFPLVHTGNIRVEMSQVRLRLPEAREWFAFGGTMRREQQAGEFKLSEVSYYNKQFESLLDVVQDGEEMAKVRAAGNLMRYRSQLQSNSSADFSSNKDFQREIQNSEMLLEQADQVLGEQEAIKGRASTDNGSLLLFRCTAQPLNRSKNVVTQLESNFEVANARAEPAGKSAEARPILDQRFNSAWLEGNQLGLPAAKLDEAARKQTRGLNLTDEKARAGGEAKKSELDRTVNELGKIVTQQVESQSAAASSVDREGKSAARGGLIEQRDKYQQRLESRGSLVQSSTPAAPNGMGGITGGQEMQNMPGTGSTSGMPQLPGMAGFGFGGMAEGAAPNSGVPQAGDVSFADGGTRGLSSTAYQGLASLEVAIPERGDEYLFLTPRGEIQIEAWTVESRQVGRIVPLLAMLAGLASVWLLPRAVRRATS